MKQKNNKKSLLRNGAFSIGYKLINVLFPLFSATYVARILLPEGTGKVAYAQNIVSYFLLIAALGIPYYGTREIARCRDNLPEKRKVFTELVTINFIATAVCLVAYGFFVYLVFPENILLYAICGLELFFNLFNIDWLYQGEEEYVYITIRSVAIKLLSLICLFTFVKDIQDYLIYALIYSLGVGGNHLINLLNARKIVRLSFRNLNCGRHIRPVMVLLLSSVTASLYNKLDTTILGWLSTDEAVGLYTNAHKVISIALTLVVAVSSVFFPRLSYVYETERTLYRKYISVGLKIVLLLAVPCCLGVMIVSDNLIQALFGESFAPAGTTLRILAVFTVVKGAGDLLCYQSIISSGNENKLITARIVAGLVNVVLNLWLIPIYDYNGAAIAAVTSELLVNGMLLPVSLKIAKPQIGKKFLFTLLLSSLFMFFVTWTAQYFLKPGIVSLCVTVVVAMIAYFVGLIVTKNDMLLSILKREDRTLLE